MSERQIKAGQMFKLFGEYECDGHVVYVAKKDFDMKEVSEAAWRNWEDPHGSMMFGWEEGVTKRLIEEDLVEKVEMTEFSLSSIHFAKGSPQAEMDAKFKDILEREFHA